MIYQLDFVLPGGAGEPEWLLEPAPTGVRSPVGTGEALFTSPSEKKRFCTAWA